MNNVPEIYEKRRLEIDAILKEIERLIKSDSIKYISLGEFKKRIKEKER